MMLESDFPDSVRLLFPHLNTKNKDTTNALTREKQDCEDSCPEGLAYLDGGFQPKTYGLT